MSCETCSATTYGTCDLEGRAEVVTLPLDATDDAVRASTELLSSAERERASRFAFDADRRRFTISRAGLRSLLGARLGLPARDVEFTYGKNGKPALARSQPECDVRFNVAHSGDWAVYAFAMGREIGVDVEIFRKIPNANNIAVRFFSSRENESYDRLAPIDKPLGFLNCWTRKEAFIKAVGDGMTYPLRSFDVSLDPDTPAEILRVGSERGANCGWVLYDIPFGPDIVGACVVRAQDLVFSTAA